MDKKDEEQHSMSKPKPLEVVSDGDLTEIKKDPVWKSWLDNVTKPIPDSKGGKGSFQHCIDTNQDKHNPGGWCKQIERKIGKAKKVPNKEVKLPQTKIDEPKHHWDHSKVGRNTGWEDNPMNKPSYFFAVMEEERKKKEKEKKKIAEKPESDYYMDAGGNPQRKEKAKKILATSSVSGKKVDISSMIHYPPVFSGTDSELAAQKEKIDEADTNKKEKVEANTSDANKTDYFVEEIRSNIIYHNKILPIIGMIASQAARGMGKMGKKIGSEVLEGASEVGQGMLQGVGDEAEEEEQ